MNYGTELVEFYSVIPASRLIGPALAQHIVTARAIPMASINLVMLLVRPNNITHRLRMDLYSRIEVADVTGISPSYSSQRLGYKQRAILGTIIIIFYEISTRPDSVMMGNMDTQV